MLYDTQNPLRRPEQTNDIVIHLKLIYMEPLLIHYKIFKIGIKKNLRLYLIKYKNHYGRFFIISYI
jgi:hypothetical protein